MTPVRFIVAVRGVDDSFTAYGPWRTYEKASAFAGSFNNKVERYEREHPDEPDGVAWAYVMELHPPSAKAAVKASGLGA